MSGTARPGWSSRSRSPTIALERRWTHPPAHPGLAPGEIHVWRAATNLSRASVWELGRTLSPDERERAQQFAFECDRSRFIVARALLRRILGHYLGVAPHDLRFSRGPAGKPALHQTAGADDLEFNLAHSGVLVLYAITRGRSVGVDLERIRPIADLERLARRVMTAREHALFLAKPPPDRLEAFFRCWTRKEAVVKAYGDGLSRPLDRIEVSLDPGEAPRVVRVEGEPASLWSVRGLAPASGYVGALATQGDDRRLNCWLFPHRRENRDLPP